MCADVACRSFSLNLFTSNNEMENFLQKLTHFLRERDNTVRDVPCDVACDRMNFLIRVCVVCSLLFGFQCPTQQQMTNLANQIAWPYRGQKEKEEQKILGLSRTFSLREISTSRIWSRGVVPISDCERRLIGIPIRANGNLSQISFCSFR